MPCRYVATGTTGRNVSLWDACAYESSLGKRVVADVQLPCDGSGVQAGLVLNWHLVGVALRENYFFAALDRGNGRLKLLFWTGSMFVSFGEAGPLTIDCDLVYRLTAKITASGPVNTRIQLEAANASGGAVLAQLEVTTSRYLPDDGLFGLSSNLGPAEFSRFEVTEYP